MILPVGYLKLWRELYLKPIWTDSTPEQKVILVTLLGMANFSDREWEWQGKSFKAQKGQFVTSLNSIVKNAGKGITVMKVRTSLDRFEKYGFLTSETTNKNRLITIANWELYQSDNKNITSKLTGTQQAVNKQLTTKEEGKEVKKDKKDIYIVSQHLFMAKEEYDKLVSQYGKTAVDNKVEYSRNYAKLKNYKSLYLTINNWLKADGNKEQQIDDYSDYE